MKSFDQWFVENKDEFEKMRVASGMKYTESHKQWNRKSVASELKPIVKSILPQIIEALRKCNYPVDNTINYYCKDTDKMDCFAESMAYALTEDFDAIVAED